MPNLRERIASLRLPPLPGGARLWVTLLSLGFVLAALKGNIESLLELRLDPQGWLWLTIGMGVSLLSLALNGITWIVCLRWLGWPPAWGGTLRLYLRTNLLKYIPGGIWHLAARVQALRSGSGLLSAPLATPQALLGVLIDPLVAACAGLALVATGGWQNGLGLIGVVPLVLLAPRWFRPLLLRLERQRARQLHLTDAEAPPDPDTGSAWTAPELPGYPLPPLLAQLVFLLARFAGFACCVLAFDQQLSLGWPSWLAAFSLAWTAGLVVPGAPGGLGVFEAVLLLRLGGQLQEAPLLAIALTYRLVASGADLLAALTARLDGWLADRRAVEPV